MNNRNTRKESEMCSKLTIKTSERRQLTYFTPFSSVSIVDFEHVKVIWEADINHLKPNQKYLTNQEIFFSSTIWDTGIC